MTGWNRLRQCQFAVEVKLGAHGLDLTGLPTVRRSALVEHGCVPVAEGGAKPPGWLQQVLHRL